MKTAVKIQLATMMFLEFFIWGAWYVTMGTYLTQAFKASGTALAQAYETQSIGALIAPFIIGLIADRYFAAQKVLGILHLLGGTLLLLAGRQGQFSDFYPFILCYMILFMPTLALVNAVAFRQMKDPSKEFASIRTLGTLGWIVAGFVIGSMGWEQTLSLEKTFFMAGTASCCLGLFSFSLPNTPPHKDKNEKINLKAILGLEALALLKDRSYLLFFVTSILLCIPLAFYYQHANQFLNELGMEAAASKMALGQFSELLFLLLLPYVLKRFGFKTTLIIGLLGWGIRYLLFAFGSLETSSWMLFLGILLHGICYDFFFVSGQIYTDAKAGKKYRSAAQGLITLATYGVGMMIGFRVAGTLTDFYQLSAGHNWQQIWLKPSIFAFTVLILFLITFKNQPLNKKQYE